VKILQANVCPVQLIRSIFEKVKTTKLPCSRHLCRIVPLSKVFFANEAEFETNIKNLIADAFDLPRPVDMTTPPPSAGIPASVEVAVSELDEQPSKKMRQEDDAAVPTTTPSENIDSAASSTIVDASTPLEMEAGSKRSLLELQQSNNAPSRLLPVTMLFKKRNHNTLNRIWVQQQIFSNIPRSQCCVDFKHPQVRPSTSPPPLALLAVSQHEQLVVRQIRAARRIEGVKHPIDLTLSRPPHRPWPFRRGGESVSQNVRRSSSPILFGR
jgi:hypothetical protein